MRGIKKKRAGGLETETHRPTYKSDELALAVKALVPLRHKAVNGCLVKFPGLRVKQFRCESFADQSLFLGDQKWRNCRERGLESMEGDRV